MRIDLFQEGVAIILRVTRDDSWLAELTLAGADPGFQKGGGTPKLSGKIPRINDIHDPFD